MAGGKTDNGRKPKDDTTLKSSQTEIQWIGEQTIQTGTEFEISGCIRVTRGNLNLNNIPVELIRGVEVLCRGNTDLSGKFFCKFKMPLSLAGQPTQIQVMLGNADSARITVTINLPAAKEQQPAQSVKGKDNDPEMLKVTSHHDGKGKFTLFVRITKSGGIGIKTPFVVENGSEHEDFQTDKDGLAAIELQPILQPGEIRKVRVIVSGIEDIAEIHLRRPKRKKVPTFWRSRYLGWLVKVNNGRATILLAITLFFLLKGLMTSWDDSLLMPHHKALTAQEEIYNSIIASTSPAKSMSENGVQNATFADPRIVKPDEDNNVTQVQYFVRWFFFALFSVLYTIFSWREEFIEALQETYNNLVDRRSDVVKDPALDRFAAWVGSYGIARKQPPNAPVVQTTTTTNAPAAAKKSTGIWSFFTSEYFKADVASELALKLLSKIFRIPSLSF